MVENKTPKILWIVTARSGSKSIKHKNIKLLNGKPLMSYIIRSVIKSKYSEYVYISTDSLKYAKIAEKFGAKFEFLRPKDISSDSSSSNDAVLHLIKEINAESFNFDYVGLLEPTTPFISSEHINNAVAAITSDTSALSLIAVKKNRPNSFFIQDDDKYLTGIYKNILKKNSLVRQAFKDQITPCGGLYISSWSNFLKEKSFYTKKTIPFLIEEINSIEIDEPLDFMFAEFLIKNNYIEKFLR